MKKLLLLSTLFLANGTLAMMNSNSKVDAASVENKEQVVTINYSGKGNVAVWDNYTAPQRTTGKYLADKTSWKSYKVATLDNQKRWYNLGGNQWVDGDYITQSNTQNDKNVTNVSGTLKISYDGAGKVAVWNNYTSPQRTTGQYLSKNTNWRYYKIAKVGQKTWYNLGGNQWVDGQYIIENKSKLLNFEYTSQLYPTFAPAGCEGAALKMAMSVKGLGKGQSLESILNAMPRSTDPNTGFSGDPYDYARGRLVTIYPAPLTAFARQLGANAQDISGSSTAAIADEILNGNPVIFWGNLHSTASGSLHVMTIVGYEPGRFLVADPYRMENASGKTYWITLDQFTSQYNERGRRAVVIL